MLCRENQIDHNSIVGIDFTAVRNIGGNQTEIGFFQKDQLRTNMDRSASIQKIFNLIEIVDVRPLLNVSRMKEKIYLLRFFQKLTIRNDSGTAEIGMKESLIALFIRKELLQFFLMREIVIKGYFVFIQEFS